MIIILICKRLFDVRLGILASGDAAHRPRLKAGDRREDFGTGSLKDDAEASRRQKKPRVPDGDPGLCEPATFP